MTKLDGEGWVPLNHTLKENLSWNDMCNQIKQQQYAKINDTSTKYKYKYKEDQIIADFHAYIDKTYGQHYMTEEQNIECFDVWLALGDPTPTFRNTAIKYLWRYGKKHGTNKQDLLKVLHYVIMMLYADHYKDTK